MASEQPTDAWNEPARATDVWREKRRNTLDAWLERSHERFLNIPGFLGIAFPGPHNDLRIRMENKDGVHAAMDVLRAAQAEGIEVHIDRLVIVRENGSDTAPYAIQPAVLD